MLNASILATAGLPQRINDGYIRELSCRTAEVLL